MTADNWVESTVARKVEKRAGMMADLTVENSVGWTVAKMAALTAAPMVA